MKKRGATFLRRAALWALLMLAVLLPLDITYGNYYNNIQRIDASVKKSAALFKTMDMMHEEISSKHGKKIDAYRDHAVLREVKNVTYAYLSTLDGKLLVAQPPEAGNELAALAADKKLLEAAAQIHSAPEKLHDYFTTLGTVINPQLQTEITLLGSRQINTVQLLQSSPNLLLGYGIKAESPFDISSSFLFAHRNIALLILLLISGGLAVLVRPYTLTIRTLITYAQKVAAHDFSMPLTINMRNEVGILSSAMRDMAEEVAYSLDRMELRVKEATASSNYSLEQLSAIINSINDGLVVLDVDNVIIRCNACLKNLFNWPDPIEGRCLRDIMRGVLDEKNSSRAESWHNFFTRLGSGQSFITELPQDSNGRSFWLEVHVTWQSIVDRHMALCLFRDITARRSMEEELRRSRDNLENMVQERTSEFVRVNAKLRLENAERRMVEQALLRAEARYRDIVDNAIEGVFQRAIDGRMISANPAMARILGYANPDDLLTTFLTPGQMMCYAAETERAIIELLDVRGWVSGLEFQAKMQDNSPVWVSMNARRVMDEHGEPLYYEAFIEDITSRKKTEEKLMHQAFHDPLTGLPNRTLFLDRLRMVLRKFKRNESYQFAVLYLDLNRFKNINDIFGHSAGDEILAHAAHQLQLCVREADTVARFGGDEFAVLLDDIDIASTPIEVARRIGSALSQPITFHGQEVRTGASIGIVISGATYNSPEEVLRDADTAMYRAKKHDSQQFMVFNERMREETEENLSLEYDLHRAIERDEIMMHYQPLIEISTGDVYGFEALMRWDKQGEIISPARFIPIAEESDLINGLGMHMLRMVCNMLSNWDTLYGVKNITMHVNISGRQFMSPHFPQDVGAILKETQVNPDLLVFEITESVLLDHGGQVVMMMRKLQEMGIRFCLDDFGTGFSSLSYLRILPLESMKVDRSFITELETDPHSFAIVRNLISMGHDIGLNIVTEGVERNTQVDMLLSTGCRYAQGYYFSMPLSEIAALEFLRDHGLAN